MKSKFNNRDISTLLGIVENLVLENKELKKRLAIIEQILRMHLPIIEKD